MSPKLTLLILTGLASGSAVHGQSDAAAVETYRQQVGPMLQQYCVKCHSGVKPKAGFAMDKLDLKQLGGAQSKKWLRIAEQLRLGEMPPEEKPQPTAAQRKQTVNWLTAELRRAGVETSEIEAEPTGKYVDHELLFSAPVTARLDNPPRLWRFSPEIYARWILKSGSNITSAPGQAMTAAGGHGFQDQAAAATIDEGTLAVVLRNAQQTAAATVAHYLERGKVSGDKTPGGSLADLLDAKTPLDLEKMEHFINTFAFYRRWGRYTPAEIKPLMELCARAEKIGGRAAALRAVLVAIQLQPEALYRMELGLGPEDARGYRLLGPRELAYAISFALGDMLEKSTAVLANAGKLNTREAAVAEIQRLMDDPAFAKPRILRFFQEYFAYTSAPEVFKDNAKELGHHAVTLVSDTDQLIEYVLEKDQDVLRTLLTTNLSYVAGRPDRQTGKVIQQLPKIPVYLSYGLREWPASQPVALPAAQRAGILTQPSWLVAQSGNFDNHPVQRGRWIREKLLGGSVPPVPITVNAQVPDAPERTLRDKLNEITRVEYCWQCHSRMNQLGLPFEQFDHLGRFRSEDLVVDPGKPPLAPKKKGGMPVPVMRALALDVSGSVDRTGDPKLDGPVANPIAMVKRLADSTRVRQVFVRHAFRYWMGRDENPGDAATLRAADQAYVSSGGSMKALIISLLSSDSFLYRTAPAPTATAQCRGGSVRECGRAASDVSVARFGNDAGGTSAYADRAASTPCRSQQSRTPNPRHDS